MAIVYVKGRRIDQEALRKFLAGVVLDDCEQEDGTWQSPISGEIFATRQAMVGSFGTYLRKSAAKDPHEPTRRGYVRAIRAGIKPTEPQKAAHAAYMRDLRAGRKRSAPIVEERLAAIEAAEPMRVTRERVEAERAERVAARKLQADEAYAASLAQLLP